MEYLEANKKSFGILIDYQKVRIAALLNQKQVCGNNVENIWYTQILKELFQILKFNYQNVTTEFQSIFELHELCITLCVDYLIKNGVKFDDSASKILYDLNETATKLDAPFDEGVVDQPNMELFNHLYASFGKFEDFGLDKDDKSVNAHNCRKSAILSQMFAVHKLIVLGKAEKGLSLGIKQHFCKYASAYLELTSVVADLQLYVLHLDESQRKEILENLSSKKCATPVR